MPKGPKRPAVMYRINAPDSWLTKYAGTWQVWKRYNSAAAANEAVEALRKSKPDYFEFKVRE